MIDLDGVEQRAAELGRATTPSGAVTEPAATSQGVPAPAVVPPGTMIVPVDAWNKMLNQLGNLHEAGQQLAAAKERAAKAETEAKFLRERLAELRQAEGSAESTAQPPSPAERAAAESQPPEKFWQYAIRRVRDRNLG